MSEGVAGNGDDGRSDPEGLAHLVHSGLRPRQKPADHVESEIPENPPMQTELPGLQAPGMEMTASIFS